jgi:Mg2+/Co2+ transporter CorB
VILFLLMCSAFFSGSETALTAASRGKLRNMADRGEAGRERGGPGADAEGGQ